MTFSFQKKLWILDEKLRFNMQTYQWILTKSHSVYLSCRSKRGFLRNDFLNVNKKPQGFFSLHTLLHVSFNFLNALTSNYVVSNSLFPMRYYTFLPSKYLLYKVKKCKILNIFSTKLKPVRSTLSYWNWLMLPNRKSKTSLKKLVLISKHYNFFMS